MKNYDRWTMIAGSIWRGILKQKRSDIRLGVNIDCSLHTEIYSTHLDFANLRKYQHEYNQAN